MIEQYLHKLVSFYSVSTDQKSVLRLLQYVEKHLGSHGLKTQILTYNGVHNLYASSTGQKHNTVLLQAHADVVPGADQPFYVKDEAYHGRGTYDMLFAIACYMRLCDEVDIRKLNISLMLSGDEELGGFNGVQAFLHEGYTADVCILPDAGTGFGTLNVAAKGMYNLTVRIHGAAHHGSRPWEGDGAAAKLVHFLIEAEKIFDTSHQDHSTMTIAKLVGGDADNRGPAFADAILDIRYADQKDRSRIQKEMKTLLAKYNGEIILQIDGDDYQLDTEHKHVTSFLKIYKEHHDNPIKLVKAFGSSDARFFSARDIPVIMLRPDGGGAHGDNEWVSVHSTEKFYQLLKKYVVKTATIGA